MFRVPGLLGLGFRASDFVIKGGNTVSKDQSVERGPRKPPRSLAVSDLGLRP